MITIGKAAKILNQFGKPEFKPTPPQQLRQDKHIQSPNRRREIIAGGDIKWKPVDRQASLLLAKAPWWAFAPAEKQTVKTNKQTKMKPAIENINGVRQTIGDADSDTKQAVKELEIKPPYCGVDAHGWNVVDTEKLKALIAEEVIKKMPEKMSPAVSAARDARKIMDEMLLGIGDDLVRFRASIRAHCVEIQQTRYFMVAETAKIAGPLREVRQFFLSSDYKEEVARLSQFVDLCERLQKLKESGFLDKVADTMLTLSVK
jgi:hypothetical protein